LVLVVFEQHRIVHNGIKPENIFIAHAHEPKIGDFELSRSTVHAPVAASSRACQDALLSTHLLESSAKLAMFSSSAVSYQPDVHSVGVVLWYLIMGRARMSPGAASATLLTKDNINDVALRSIVNDMLHIDPGKPFLKRM
jgi:serine/threonine protein kinase